MWPATVMLLLAPLTFIVLGVVLSSIEVVLAGVAIGIASSFPMAAVVGTIVWSAAWVTVTDEHIAARNYVGFKRQFSWSEVVVRREFEGPTTLYGTGMRLGVTLVVESGRLFQFDENLPGFEELYEIVRAKTAHAYETGDVRAGWRRLFGFPK